jgi:hypothetical protein
MMNPESQPLTIGRLVELYTNESENLKFRVGYVRALSGDALILEALDKYGNHDGMDTIPLDDVFRVGYDTPYLRLVEFLYLDKDKAYRDGPAELLEYDPETSLLEQELHKAAADQDVGECMVGRGDDHTCVTGIIKSFDGEWITVQELDCNGLNDGTTALRLSAVTRFSRGGLDERTLKAYFSAQKKDK